jgi:small subunit ribosomal protein S8
MSLTDPVADFLARIRNAIRARHQKLDVPASKLKAEIARILKEEGYISNYKTQEEEGKQILRVYLKYGGRKRPSAIWRASRVPAAACTLAATRSSASRAAWHLDHDHAQGRDDRPSGAPRRRGRRTAV